MFWKKHPNILSWRMSPLSVTEADSLVRTQRRLVVGRWGQPLSPQIRSIPLILIRVGVGVNWDNCPTGSSYGGVGRGGKLDGWILAEDDDFWWATLVKIDFSSYAQSDGVPRDHTSLDFI